MALATVRLGYKDSAWFAANPTYVLEEGQHVYLQQTGTYKLGDGITQLSVLSFLGAGGESVTVINLDITGVDTINLTGLSGTILFILSSSNSAEVINEFINYTDVDYVYLCPNSSLNITFNLDGNFILAAPSLTAYGLYSGFLKLYKLGTQFRQESFIDQYEPKNPALFGSLAQYIDGTIIGNEFIDKSGNGRNLDIINNDITVRGFPYKSIALIAQKAANFGVIPDINNFWFTAGVPNQIPVVSLFQNIEYANQIFCKHSPRVLDINGAEIYEPRVLEIATYNQVLAAGNLTAASSYFSVPTEVVSNVIWIDPVNGVNGNAGTRTLPKQTFAAAFAAITTGGTVYMKNGNSTTQTFLQSKGCNFIGTGFSRITVAGTTCMYADNSVNTTPIVIKGLVISGGTIAIQTNTTLSGGITLLNCYLGGSSNTVYANVSNSTLCLLRNCILTSQLFQFASLLQVDTCLFSQITLSPIRIDKNLTSTNNKYTGTSALGLIACTSATTSITSIGDTINGNYIVDSNAGIIGAFSVSYAKWKPNATGLFINIIAANPALNFILVGNTFTQTYFSAGTGINLKGANITFNNNIYAQQNGFYLDITALSSGKTFTMSGNSMIGNNYPSAIVCKDYKCSIFNNKITSNDKTSISLRAVNYTGLASDVYNNYISMKVDGADPVIIGTEYSLTLDGRFSGSKVYNNTFLGPRYFGNPSTTAHALFTWSNTVDWYNNYVNGFLLGIVLKSNGGTFPSKVYGNIIVDTDGALICKGVKGVQYIGNTIINTNYTGPAYSGNAETNPGTPGDSGNTEIKNNIFVNTSPITTPTSSLVYFESATQQTGCVINYNVYYNETLGCVGRVNATTYTLTSWQGIGYDASSLEQDPLLINSTTKPYPLTAINSAQSQSIPFNTGLDVATNFNVGNVLLPSIVNRNQPVTAQNGAYIQ